LKFCPVRRINDPENETEPSQYRLCTVFMAAEPRDTKNPLSYEDEESSVINAAGDIGMDLAVEESGTLEFLSELVSQEKPDVLHISCHGNNSPEPLLNLEDQDGNAKPASVSDLDDALADHKPKLLFLSACLTSAPAGKEAEELVSSFAGSMIRLGCPAVLGWGGSVGDKDASVFAAELYRLLSKQNSLETAGARARFKLLEPDRNKPGDSPSEYWHMARLWLGRNGGGILCGSGFARRPGAAERGHREFLDKKQNLVPVAGYHEFVGRRRKIQDILREFRKNQPAKAGVLIHGFGGQGKSSLAARIANRMKDHQAVVIFGGENELHRYGAQGVLTALRDAFTNRNLKEIADSYLSDLRRDPSMLAQVLRELLEGHCSGLKPETRPVLLIIDDFEKILKKPAGTGFHTVDPDFIETVRAVIQAFNRACTKSRLLITSRYNFTLPSDRGEDMAGLLMPVHLPPMQNYESRKQAVAKARAISVLHGKKDEDEAAEFRKLVNLCIETAKGNPRLQDRLFTLAAESPGKCVSILDRMGKYLSGDESPDDQDLRDFLESLLICELTGLLSRSEKEMLQASSMFSVPVPVAVFEVLCRETGVKTGAIERLAGLTLWDAFEDMVKPSVTAFALNALVRAMAFEPVQECKTGAKAELLQEWKLTLSHDKQAILAQITLPVLFECWSGADRPRIADYQLAYLGVMTENAEVLEVAAENGLTWLREQFRYLEAAEIARNVIRILDEAEIKPSPVLLRVACERCQQVGDADNALAFIKRSTDIFESRKKNGEMADESDYSHSLSTYARLLQQRGEIDKA
ncbi:MAG: CHAT domain-containing protein, partial [Desulfobacteraceae bacterium]|nr:CHAT domain-containing protein [Desulfobacteraceae bacterium]